MSCEPFIRHFDQIIDDLDVRLDLFLGGIQPNHNIMQHGLQL